MKICIIIPVHNGRDDTLACLESLEAAIDQREHTVLVINNGSTDGTAVAIVECFPFVHLLTNPSNQSFSKSVNQGARYAWRYGAEAILLLNNDTVVMRDFLSKLESDPFFRNGISSIVSPRIVYFDWPETIWYDGGCVELALGRIYHRRIGEPVASNEPCCQLCDFSTGCAMLVTRRCFAAVGGFNESFNFYGEDVDFCKRAEKLNFLSCCNGYSVIKHKVSSSSTPFRKMRMKLSGEARLLWKHNKAKDLPMAFAGFAIFNLWRLIKNYMNFQKTKKPTIGVQ